MVIYYTFQPLSIVDFTKSFHAQDFPKGFGGAGATTSTLLGRGPPLMVSICRATGKIKMDYSGDEFLELEEAEVERIRQLPQENWLDNFE